MSEETRPRIWTLVVASTVLVAGLIVLARLILPGYVILSSRAVLAGGPLAPPDRAVDFYATLPGLLLAATLDAAWIGLVAVVAGLLSSNPLPARLGLLPARATPLAWLVVPLGGVALNQAVDSLFELSRGGRGPELDALLATLATARGPALALELLVIGVLAATCEELFFRGYLQRRLVARLGPALGIALPAALFGIAHMDPHHSTFAFLFGLFVGYAAWAADSTWIAIATHVANNTISVLSLALGAGDAGASRVERAVTCALSFLATFAVVAWFARRGVRPRAEAA